VRSEKELEPELENRKNIAPKEVRHTARRSELRDNTGSQLSPISLRQAGSELFQSPLRNSSYERNTQSDAVNNLQQLFTEDQQRVISLAWTPSSDRTRNPQQMQGPVDAIEQRDHERKGKRQGINMALVQRAIHQNQLMETGQLRFW
jgi:hypothetical protein